MTFSKKPDTSFYLGRMNLHISSKEFRQKHVVEDLMRTFIVKKELTPKISLCVQFLSKSGAEVIEKGIRTKTVYRDFDFERIQSELAPLDLERDEWITYFADKAGNSYIYVKPYDVAIKYSDKGNINVF